MFDEILRKANDLLDANEAFALAVVVRREAPISARTGDKAVIQANGKIAGWIGGGCTQPLVIKEAQNAIRDGRPRLVRVTPRSSKDPLEGISEYNMTCHSGGTIDVYIEPFLPKPHLIILGKSPVAQVLARLAGILNYRVSVFAPDADETLFPSVDLLKPTFELEGEFGTDQTYSVVCTQGQDDEEALEAALKLEGGYIGFVASRKKAEAVCNFLQKRGLAENQLQRIKAPAGLDIKAHLPEEVALSILSEIIQMRNAEPHPGASAEIKDNLAEAIDPICGMSVTIQTAKHRSEYQDESFYFCCAGCKQTFDQAPEKYVEPRQRAQSHKDPVCGMSVGPDSTKHLSDYKGETIYFCCAGCKESFDKEPDKYLPVHEH